MKISKLKLVNFNSYKGENVFLFDGTTSQKHVVLVGGMNGAGKTSVLEAIDLCLYGDTNKHEIYKRINRTALRNGNVSLTIELEIIDEENTYTIQRSWSSTKLFGEVIPSDLSENLIVRRNGQIQSYTQETWRDFISSTIPQGIIKFFFFNGEKVQELADMDRVGPQLRQDLEQVLGIEIIRQLIDDLQRIRSDFIRNSDTISEADLEKVNNDIDYVQKKLREVTDSRDDEQASLNEYINQIQNISTQIRSFLGFNPELLVKHNQLLKAKTDLEAKIKAIDSAIVQNVDTYLPYMLLQPHFQSIRNQIESEGIVKQKQALNQKADELAQTIIDEVILPIAPSTPNQVGEIKDKLVQIITGQESIETLMLLDLTETQTRKLLAILTKLESGYGQGITSLIEEKQSLQNSVNETDRELDRTSLPPNDLEKYEELRKDEQDLIRQEARAREKISQYNDQIYDLEQQREQFQSQMEQLAETFEGTKDQKQKVKLYTQYIDTLEEYVQELKKNKLNELRSHVLDMYRKLASKQVLIGDLSIDEHTYNITVYDPEHNPIDYRNSEGEKEVLTVAILWGLAQCTDFKLPIIIDTPLARLDSHHRTTMVQEYFPYASEQVIILSIDEEIKPNSDYYQKLKPFIAKEMTIRFDTIKRESTIEQGYFN